MYKNLRYTANITKTKFNGHTAKADSGNRIHAYVKKTSLFLQLKDVWVE